MGAGIQKYGSEIENVPVRYKNGKVGKNVRVQSAKERHGLESVWVQLRKLSWESNNIVTIENVPVQLHKWAQLEKCTGTVHKW